jgi:hypothetical protein
MVAFLSAASTDHWPRIRTRVRWRWFVAFGCTTGSREWFVQRAILAYGWNIRLICRRRWRTLCALFAVLREHLVYVFCIESRFTPSWR